MKSSMAIRGFLTVAICVCALSGFFLTPVLGEQAPINPAATVTNGPDDPVLRQLAAVEESIAADAGSSKQQTLSSLSRLRRYIENKDFQNAVQTCDNLFSYSLSAPTSKAVKDLSALLSKQMNDDQTRAINDAQKLLADIPSLCANAKTQDELKVLGSQVQQTQATLNHLQQRGYNPDIDMLRNDLENTRNTLKMWMQVLSAEEAGDIQLALQSLASNDYLIRQNPQLQKTIGTKRSALFRKLLEQPQVSADDPLVKVINDQMTTVDSLDKLVELRRRLMPALNYSYQGMYAPAQSEVQYFMSDIQTLESMRVLMQAKRFGQVFQYRGLTGSGSHRWKSIVTHYQNQMLLKTLEELFGLGGLEVPEGQSLEQALIQAADKAAADKNWEKLAQCLDAYRITAFGSQTPPAMLTDQINACRNVIAAKNYEKIGDIERAALSYLAILNTSSKKTPFEEAVNEISRIRKEHPDIFERLRGVSVSSASPAAAPVSSAMQADAPAMR